MLTFAQAEAMDAAAIYGAEFSEPVVFWDGENSISVNGIVDLTRQEVDLDTGAAVTNTKPRVSLWAPLVPWPLKSDAGQFVVIRGLRYTIRKVDAQGDLDVSGTAEGSVVVELNRAKS